jgi:hypothetical protein
MRSSLKIALATLVLTGGALAGAPAASAGCLTGAAVGAAAGHFVGRGHAVAGGAAGCAVGAHQKNKAAREKTGQQAAATQRSQDQAATPSR